MNDKIPSIKSARGIWSWIETGFHLPAGDRRADASPKPVLRRLLLPLAVMVSVLILGAAALLWQQFYMRLEDKSLAAQAEISNALETALDHQASMLAAALEPIAADPRVHQALREKNTDRLLADWQPMFETLRRESNLTHFYFFDKNRVCLLRVHRPGKRGDMINRFTALEAERTGTTAAGIELGRLGTFTLRVVRPVFVKDELVGYVELGKEIEDILQSLYTRIGHQMAVSIRKAYLDKQTWEEGMDILGRKADWERMPHSVIIYASHGRLPDVFAPMADYDPEAGHVHGDMVREADFDGKTWRVSMMPLQDASGKEVGSLLVMSDISGEKAAFHRILTLGGISCGVLLAAFLGFVSVLLMRTDAGIGAQQAELRESQERFFKIFDKSPIPTSLSRMADSRYTEVNAAWCDFFGFSNNEAIGRTAEELNILDSETLASLREIFSQEGALAGVEVKVCTNSGVIRDILTSVELLSIGGEQYAVNMIIDITERKRMEEALQQSEIKFRDLFHKHAAVKLLIDPDTGNIIEANDAAARFYGYSIEQLRRMRIQDINMLPSEQVKAKMENVGDHQRFHFEFRHCLADGTIKDVEVFSSRIDINGKGFLHSIIHDITARRNLEDQLRQAQKMESVGRLAGGVAHDFNNMLSVILGHAELAMDELDPVHPLYADLKEIDNAARRSADLVRQLLAFARKQTIAPEVLDLNETVEGMLKLMRRLIGENIDLVWLPGQNLWPVKMDTTQIDQILANLCVNARDSMTGTGKITIETHNMTIDQAYCAHYTYFDPGDYVMLAISDNGCGMDEETRSHLFEPFYTTKEVGRGTGLGLATVYGIVKQNSGFITVDSEPGRGTTFKIYLPRHAAAAKKDQERVSATPLARGNETILLVEDEPSILKMGRTLLERLGYRVLTAAAPEEAIRLAGEYAGKIHLLMTDVVMPGMNGQELAENLMSLYPDMKRLFMSGYTADIIASQGVLDGGVHFIQKPFAKHDLAVKVRKALDH